MLSLRILLHVLLPHLTHAALTAPNTVVATPAGNGSLFITWNVATNIPIALPTPPTQTMKESTVFSPLVGNWLPSATAIINGEATPLGKRRVDIAAFDHRFNLVCLSYKTGSTQNTVATGCFTTRVDGFTGCSMRSTAGVCTSGTVWEDGVKAGQLSGNEASTSHAAWLQPSQSNPGVMGLTPHQPVRIAVLDVPNQQGLKLDALVCHLYTTSGYALRCRMGKRMKGSGYPDFIRPRFTFMDPIISGDFASESGISMACLKATRLVVLCGLAGGPPKDLSCILIGDPDNNAWNQNHHEPKYHKQMGNVGQFSRPASGSYNFNPNANSLHITHVHVVAVVHFVCVSYHK